VTARVMLVVLALGLLSCAQPVITADNAAALRDIAARRSGTEEVVEGTVLSVLPNSHGPSGVHERFVVDVRAAGSDVPLYVTDNISVGDVALMHNGERVTVKGELAFNEYGPLLHWTHRDLGMRHAPGFVEVGGHIYE